MIGKTRNHGYDVIVGGRLFTDYSITLPRKLVTLNPAQINGRGRWLFPIDADAHRKQRPERLLSEKSGRCGIAAD